MKRVPIYAVVCFLLVPLAIAGPANTAGDSETNGDPCPATPGLRDSTVTRIAAFEQENGVGNLRSYATNPWICEVVSQPVAAVVSRLIGCSQFIWIIWDMAVVPEDAEIVSVEIEHELDPDTGHSYPETILWYRSLENTYLPPPDCSIATDDMIASSLYTEVKMGTSAGLRRYVLGGNATLDVAGAVSRRGYFSLWIAIGYPGPTGAATVPGWSAGGPVLIVTWKSPVAVKNDSWGMIKALF
jgi:hypothetical protein